MSYITHSLLKGSTKGCTGQPPQSSLEVPVFAFFLHSLWCFKVQTRGYHDRESVQPQCCPCWCNNTGTNSGHVGSWGHQRTFSYLGRDTIPFVYVTGTLLHQQGTTSSRVVLSTQAAAGACSASSPKQCPKSSSMRARRWGNFELPSFYTSLPSCNAISSMHVIGLRGHFTISASLKNYVLLSAEASSMPIISNFRVQNFACNLAYQKCTSSDMNCDHRLLSPQLPHRIIHTPFPLPLWSPAQLPRPFCFLNQVAITSVPSLTSLGPAFTFSLRRPAASPEVVG